MSNFNCKDKDRKEEKIKDIIHNINNYSPCIFLNDASLDFLKLYKYTVREVKNTDDVREIVSEYSMRNKTDHALVISGLSFINQRAVSILLKLVEESSFDLVLLSRFDQVSSVLLSRMKTVVKYSNNKIKSKFLDADEGLYRLNEELEKIDDHYFNKLKLMSEISPILYYLEKKMGRIRNKDKIIDIISN